ncbi:MAG: NAD(P)H-dependent flavin oxidoreductase [Kiloniellaceae bacterium]
MPLTTKLTELLGIRHPVLLAPMGGASGGALAAAVSEAGGLGLIAGAYGDPDWLEAEFQRAGSRRVGVGFITWSLAKRPDLLDLALARRPAAVMLSFGDPAPFAAAVKDAGARLICQIQTRAQAEQAAQAGADVIVAQGGEAGGHGRSRGTLALVPAVVDAVAPLPVVAAGGIADGRGLAAALMLGAVGALLGTRFYAAEECLAHPAAKRRVVTAGGDETVRTTVFDIVRALDWPAYYTGRAIGNDFSRRWHGKEGDLARAAGDERPRYAAAAAAGDFDTAVVFAGECVDLIDAVEPAGRILERVVAEAEARLRDVAELAVQAAAAAGAR